MSPRLERAALPKLLAHPAYRRHAKTEKLGNLASALASLVELENPLPHRDRNGSHGPTLSHNHVSVKIHHLWKCSKPKSSSRHNRCTSWDARVAMDPGYPSSENTNSSSFQSFVLGYATASWFKLKSERPG